MNQYNPDKNLLVQSLGLFTLPPMLKKKTQEQKKQESQIHSQYRDFFHDSVTSMDIDTEEPEEARKKQREQEELNKKREQHLQQMDATKKMYINEIMRRTTFEENFDSFWDMAYQVDSEEDQLRNEERRMMS